MKTLIMSGLLLFSLSAFSTEHNASQNIQSHQPANCVNPGGSCDGTIPCCDPYHHACFYRRCMRAQPQQIDWTSLGQPVSTPSNQ